MTCSKFEINYSRTALKMRASVCWGPNTAQVRAVQVFNVIQPNLTFLQHEKQRGPGVVKASVHQHMLARKVMLSY